ncbi:MAG: alpha/beta hydrolase [Clostridiales bacterium]|nr:alpha/beta hydrolase [Clostridiales bacterium]
MKLFTKIISVLLALVIFCAPISAAEGEAYNDSACPRIYVHGFMAHRIISDKEDESSPDIFPPSMNDIFSKVKDSVPALAAAYVNGGIEGFGDEACNVANDLMSQVYLDENCEVKDSSGVYFEYPAASSITKNSKLEFKYDWRLDPIDIAAQLNDFIDYVLDCSGAKKVNLSAHSLGGVIVVTYVSIYGTEKVQGACFNAAAVFGESYTGDLMSGKMQFNGKAFDYFLTYLADSTEYQYLVKAIIDAADAAGVFDLTAAALNALLDKVNYQVSTQVMMPMFCRWLTIWAMIPDDDIDESMDYVFNDLLKDKEHTALQSKVERFNTLVRDHKKETLIKLNEDAHMYVISRYGYTSAPVTPSYAQLSDGTVDTRASSFGATTALYRTTLSEDHIKSVAPEYISPDKTVDASTCMFPDRTWFIRAFKHDALPYSLEKFIDMLLEQEEQATVDTFEQYPRFLVYEAIDDQILPDNNYPKELTVIERVIKIVVELFKLISSLFKKIA